jgi:hypothetical protein
MDDLVELQSAEGAEDSRDVSVARERTISKASGREEVVDPFKTERGAWI